MTFNVKSLGLITCLLWLTLSCFTSESNPTQGISASWHTGQAHQLASYFDTDLALRIDPVGVDYHSVQAGQAELIMRAFFMKYPPVRFQAAEQGLTAHLRYANGTYWSGGRAFRVNVLMRQATPGHYRIHSIQVND